MSRAVEKDPVSRRAFSQVNGGGPVVVSVVRQGMGVGATQKSAADIHAVRSNRDVVRIDGEGHSMEDTGRSRTRAVCRTLSKARVDHMVFGDAVQYAVIVLAAGAILSRDVFFAAPVSTVAVQEGVVAGIRRGHLLGDGPNVISGIGHGVVPG